MAEAQPWQAACLAEAQVLALPQWAVLEQGMAPQRAVLEEGTAGLHGEEGGFPYASSRLGRGGALLIAALLAAKAKTESFLQTSTSLCHSCAAN